MANDGNKTTGKYLFRASAKSSVVLSVTFKGKITHHQVSTSGCVGCFM